MFCKFCGKVIEDDLPTCPECGRDLSQPVVNPQNSLNPTPAETPKKKVWPMIVGISVTVILLAVLGYFLLDQFGVWDGKDPKETTAATTGDGTEATGEATEPEATVNPEFVASNYAVPNEQAATKGDVVVATMGNAELTNSTLQIYYRLQIMEFLNYYGSYLSYIGLDYTQPLGKQPCYYDDKISWEAFFVNTAIETWQQDQALAQLAAEEGFTLDPELEAEFENIEASLEKQATDGGYENAEAMIKDVLGPANTLEGYMAYIRLSTIASEYYGSVYDAAQPTDEEAKTYYEENKATFEESGITLDCGLESAVRHILVSPEISEGASEATESQWKACLAEAERILQEWKDGEATEESFVALVPTYTADTGSAQTGGLYENVNPTSNFVENFLEWSVDMSRQPGDTGIVESNYGYHIMYFVSGEPYWLVSARAQLVSSITKDKMEDGMTKFPMERLDDNIALCEPKLS